jgi:hypothetical protein
MHSRHSLGRPTKFTPQIAERLEWLASLGFDDDEAARQLGVGRSTLYRWLNDPRPEFREWQAGMVRAEAMAEVAITANMFRRSETDWRAAYTWLKTRHPDRWDPKVLSDRASRARKQSTPR